MKQTSGAGIRRMLWLWSSVFLLSFLLGAGALAQSTGGRVLGRVLDPTGAVIPGASLRLVNTATNVVQTAQSTATGDYQFPAVAVGTYRLEASRTGFQNLVQNNITVNINAVVTVNVHLALGQSQQTVTVNTAPPLVDTTSTQLGAVVNSTTMVSLPLNQRNSYQFMQLQPGVQTPTGGAGNFGGDSGMSSVNGMREANNNFTVNGGSANDMQFNAPLVQPSPDSIKEYRVLTNSFDAEYGRNSGSVVNVVTKSGTNNFHGDAYEFLRNTLLNSRNFFNSDRPSYHQNQYGATFGGPIRKNKAFFFASIERNAILTPTTFSGAGVMSPGERGGDFSDLPVPAGAPAGTTNTFAGTLADASILNNRTGCLAALGRSGPIADGTAYASVFPRNVIPSQCMEPTARSLISLIPAPNEPGNQFQGSDNGSQFVTKYSGRYDDALSAAHSLSFFYYAMKNGQRIPGGFGVNIPGWGQNENWLFQQYNLGETWIISPTTVNEFHFIWLREAMSQHESPWHTSLVQNSCPAATGVTNGPGGNCFNDPSIPNVGINPLLGANVEGLPFESIAGGATFGNSRQQLPQKGNVYEEQDNLTKIAGNHTFVVGADIQRQQFFQTDCWSYNGSSQIFDLGPNALGTADGNAYPDFELGLVHRYFQGGCGPENARDWILSEFGQDSWKVTPSLTVNYGLRWEISTPITDIGEAVQSFRPGQATTKYKCVLNAYDTALLGAGSSDCSLTGPAASVFPTGLIFPHDQGVGAAMYNTYKKSFAPRLGIAWSPSATSGFFGKLFGGPGRSSIRTGWGIFYQPVRQEVLLQFSGDPPFAPGSSTNDVGLATPYLGQNGTIYPNPQNGIYRWKSGDPIDFMTFEPMQFYGSFPQTMRTQYADQYNLTIQRQLPGDAMLQVAYVGTQGHRLLYIQDQNPDNPALCLQIMQIAAASAAANGLNAQGQPIGNTVVTNGLGGKPTNCSQGGGQDQDFYLPPGAIPAGMTMNLPDGQKAVGGPSSPAVYLDTLRKYGAPQCNNLTGVGCPPNGLFVFNSIFGYNMAGNSNYNSLQVMLQKRMSHGLQFQASYTWGKSLDFVSTDQSAVDPNNPRRQYGLSDFNAPQVFVFSYNWDLPVPKYAGIKGGLLSGWSFSGITTLQRGFPIPITSFADNELLNSSYYSGQGSPNVVKPFTTNNPKTTSSPGTGLPQYFNANIFDNNTQLGVFGNAARNYCCGPGLQTWDMAVHKDINLSESKYFELRGEFYNAFNHANFSNPDGEITDSTFGQIFAAGAPRLVQLGLKFYF